MCRELGVFIKIDIMSSTEKECWVALEENWKNIKCIPKELLTREMCLFAVKKCSYALEWVPQSMCTEEMCLIAVKEFWYTIKYIPLDMLTQEMCLIAVDQFRYAIDFIPRNMLTANLCTHVLNKWRGSLQLIPDEFITEEMCIMSVIASPELISWVPHNILHHSDSFYSSLLESDFSLRFDNVIPEVVYDKFIKAIWAKYDEPRAMREIIKRCEFDNLF
jgi:hypothetical protein